MRFAVSVRAFANQRRILPNGVKNSRHIHVLVRHGIAVPGRLRQTQAVSCFLDFGGAHV